MEREIICTNCPMGCHIMVVMDGEKILSVSGNTCQRGDAYARAEVTNPCRTITTTVALQNGGVLPVKTSAAVSKSRIPEYLRQIHQVTAVCPVQIGDVLIADLDGKGTHVVATANSD